MFKQNFTKTNQKRLQTSFSTKECFVDNGHDPDVNFYHDVSMLDTQFLIPDKFKTNLKDFSKNSFSVLYLNIRSTNKYFQAFTKFYLKLSHIFTVICFSETWASQENINNNSTFQLKNYSMTDQVRNLHKGGGLCIFIYESLFYKIRKLEYYKLRVLTQNLLSHFP